jgi:hypothetical protein
VIATHGRGIFALDVQPIQAYGQTPEKKEEPKSQGADAAPKKEADDENEEEELEEPGM